MRFDVEDRRWLAVDTPNGTVARAAVRVAELEPHDIFHGGTPPARRLRALVDPARLVLELDLAVERLLRVARFPPPLPLSQFSHTIR